jgi:exodeoxyribonuclease VII large subunit
VLVWPVAVQGEGAAAQVAAAVEGFGAMASPPDLVIVARGGGSIEDLWAFNEEVVVRAVAACPIPVISAVGHETDTTLCDFAADRRAPTPTAAAEMAVPVRGDLLAGLREQGARMARCSRRYHERSADRLANVARRLPAPDAILSPQQQRLDDAAARLPRALGRRLAVARGDLAQAAGALRPRLLADRLAAKRAALDGLWRLAVTLHPERPLQKGYAWVERQGDGGVVTTADAARAAGALRLHFADGTVDVSAGATPPRVERPRRRDYLPGQESLF